MESSNKKSDYKNVIYTISKKADKDDELHISLDFQRFFEPKLENSSQIKISKFLDDAHFYTSHNFQAWLEKKFGELLNCKEEDPE